MKLNKKTIYRVKTQELFDKMIKDAKKQVNNIFLSINRIVEFYQSLNRFHLSDISRRKNRQGI